MKWTAYANKNLIVPDRDDFEFQGKKYRKAVLNEYTNAKLCAMDKYWPPNSEITTSVIREPADSLRIIRGYLKSKDLARHYPEAMTGGMDDKGKDIRYPNEDLYPWQIAWSHLLNIGVIINPPLPAKCLMDYSRNGVNKKGQIIRQSPHIPDPKNPLKGAADLSGIDSLTIVKRLVEDKIIRGYLVERENNCIHCDL